MPAPAQATYSAQAKIDAQTSFRDLLDSHATLPGKIRVKDESDTTLAEMTLADPCGTVDGAGQLTLTLPIGGTSADNSGTASYCELLDGDNDVHLSLPAEQGTAAVSGKIVMNTLTITSGGPVDIVSVTIG